MTTAGIRPFRVDIPQGDLDDLAARPAATRWPGELAGAGPGCGMPLGIVQRLAERWRNGYGWRGHEACLTEVLLDERVDTQHQRPLPGFRRQRSRPAGVLGDGGASPAALTCASEDGPRR